MGFYNSFNICELKRGKWLAKHKHLFQNEVKSKWTVYFTKIQFIIDENDVKNTGKQEYKPKNHICLLDGALIVHRVIIKIK